MPSMNKTEYYGLNQWAGNEYLKRQDLNGDNAIIDVALKEHEDAIDTLDMELKRVSDKTNLIQTAGGSATAITLSNINLVNGFTVTFIVTTNNNGAATTINGIPLYKPGGTLTPELVAGKAVTVWYSTSSTCFYIKEETSNIKNVTLPAAGWTGSSAPFTNTVNVAGVTANNNICVEIGSGVSATQYAAVVDAQLHCSGQGAGSITMKAFDTKPTVDIPISVLILG